MPVRIPGRIGMHEPRAVRCRRAVPHLYTELGFLNRDIKYTHSMGTKLAPGEDSIHRCDPVKKPDGSYWMEWRFAPLDGGKTVVRRSKGSTKGETKRRARASADELRRSGSGTWKTSDLLSAYIEKVSRPAMTKAALKPLTMMRYEPALRWLVGDCDQHRHRHSLKNHTIASGIRFQILEDLLTEIASLHGRETARQCRTVLTKYVITRLMRDGLVAGNPIAGVSLDELTGTKKAERTRGGKAIKPAQYAVILDYLLGLDPADGLVKRQGRWPLEAMVAKRRNAIDQMLIQMATGLRATEANRIDWTLVDVDVHGVMSINVTKAIAKGGDARAALVLQPRVAQRLLERRNRAGGKGYVIGAPADPLKVWEPRARDKAAAALYQEIAAELGVDVMLSERSHMWRTTLRALYDGRVPPAVLNSQFGHSEQTAQKHYVDPSDLSALASAANLKVVI